MNEILKLESISLIFGGIHAVEDVSFSLETGSLTGLIGPNGAGKTSVFNVLTGMYAPTSGRVVFDGQSLGKSAPHQVVERGIARTFQNIRLFGYLSILQNILVALNPQMHYSKTEGMFRLPRYWREERAMEKRAMELLALFGLDGVAGQEAASLPYGDQRKLEIARALATHPKLLLLDEPAAGMNPTETEELMRTIALIREQFAITVLLIEHDMKLVLGICERLIVMDHGRVIAQGDPQEVVRRKEVVTAYLGEEGGEDGLVGSA